MVCSTLVLNQILVRYICCSNCTRHNHTHAPAPVCDKSLAIPENSRYTPTLASHTVGQEITIECWEGYEFTDSPAVYTPPVDHITPLGRDLFWLILLTPSLSPAPLVYAEGEWLAWEAWTACTRGCGAESRQRFRECSVGGACVGDYYEEESCSHPDCGE